MEVFMNDDVFTGQWKQLRGSLKSWWGKLTDDDLERIGGQKDKLVGLLQERYGQTRDEAERDVERRLREYDERGGAPVITSVSEFAANLSNQAREASSGLSGRVDSARSYFQNTSGDELIEDVLDMIRKYPMYACLIGLGFGYIVARGLSAPDNLEKVSRRKDRLIGSIRDKYQQTRGAAGRQAEQFNDGSLMAKLKSATSDLRANLSEKAGGAVERISSSADSARSYVHDARLDEFAGELGNVVRKYPVYACLVALAVAALAKTSLGSRNRYSDQPDW
jgi:uncharacterized protein YjbJ (UPF0337 family)